MNPKQDSTNRKKSDPKDSKKISSPNNLHKNFIFPIERELNINFCLSFKELYNIHVKEIEEKTHLKITHIYYFLIIAFIFFMLGYLELIFSYIITAYYPIIWTREDYKMNIDNFWKKWGTYWTFFACFIFFDIHRKEVLKLIPFYFTVKCIILLILYLPGFSAAVNIYNGFLKDYLHNIGTRYQNKDDNDSMLNDLKKVGKLKKE